MLNRLVQCFRPFFPKRLRSGRRRGSECVRDNVDDVSGVLTGFVVVLAIIAVGYLAARIGIVPQGSDELLTRVLFYIAMPALLFITMLGADPQQVFSPLLLGVILSVAATAILFAAFAQRRLPVRERIIGALSSCYVNAGNLGIPIAVYVLHDASLVAPVLFVQLLILAPISLAALDVLSSPGPRSVCTWLTPLLNPIVLAALLGLLLGLLPWQLPVIVHEPISLMAGAAVPLALFLYGVSLQGAIGVGAVRASPEIWLATALKNLVHPAIAFLLGTFLLHLSAPQVLALTVLSALPTAQNILVYALRYNAGANLARSAILTTTALAIPVLIAIATLLA